MQKSDQVEPVCGKGTYDLDAEGVKVGRAGLVLKARGPGVCFPQVPPWSPSRVMVAPPPPQLWGHTLVGVGFPDALCGLECVKGVGEVYVWVRFVHQIIQHIHSLHDGHVLVREASELDALERRREKPAVLHGPQRWLQGYRAASFCGSKAGRHAPAPAPAPALAPAPAPSESALGAGSFYLPADEVHRLVSVHELVGGEDSIQQRA